MKKIYYMLTGLVLALGHQSCQENDRMVYQERPSVYFSKFSTQDSLIHSLVAVKGDKDTLELVVNVLGSASAVDQYFSVRIDQEYTTAQEGIHFEKLKDKYVLPANQFQTTIPVVLYKKKEVLETGFFKLGLRLLETTEVGVGYPHKLQARVLFTNELVKPDYWDSFLKIYYGEYSKVKHQKCLDIQGFDFPGSFAEVPTTLIGSLMSYGRLVCKYFTDNTVYDEQNRHILPWPAF